MRVPIKVGEKTYYVDEDDFKKIKLWRKKAEQAFPSMK